MLEQLLDSGQVWQGRFIARLADTIDTGIPGLNEWLGTGGWPVAGIIEILHEEHGIGELSLILPLLANTPLADRWCVWVSPPCHLHAPALIQAGIALEQQLIVTPSHPREALWVVEECLRSQAVGIVLLWQEKLQARDFRRLQVLAVQQQVLVILFRSQEAPGTTCSLRLHLHCHTPGQLRVRILKRQQGWPQSAFSVQIRDIVPFLYQITEADNTLSREPPAAPSNNGDAPICGIHHT